MLLNCKRILLPSKNSDVVLNPHKKGDTSMQLKIQYKDNTMRKPTVFILKTVHL